MRSVVLYATPLAVGEAAAGHPRKTSLEAVGYGVIVAEIHGGCVGRPDPGREVRLRRILAWRTSSAGAGYFCQKSFITTSRPPETSPGRRRGRTPALARAGGEPAALSLVRFSTVQKPLCVGLDQAEVIPRGPHGERVLHLRIELGFVRNALAVLLRGVGIAAVRVRDAAVASSSTMSRLDGLGPQACSLLLAEADVAILDLLRASGTVKTTARPRMKSFDSSPSKNEDEWDHLDAGLAGVEVEAGRRREAKASG